MAAFHAELLDAAELLIAREPGQPGRLPSARVRRSVSTCYYALFHFLVDDACRRLVGSEKQAPRTTSHLDASLHTCGVKNTLNKIGGKTIDRSLSEVLRSSAGTDAVEAPLFARLMAAVFINAQARRHNADYDLNVPISEADARNLNEDCRDAIRGWQRR